MPQQEPAVVTIKVPFAVRKRGGRKLVLAPNGVPVPPVAPHIDSTLGRILIKDSQILEKVIQGSERSLGDGALRSDRV